jgi:hypothetical protein
MNASLVSIIAVCIFLIAFGIVLENQFHVNYIQPLDVARGMLIKVQATSDLQAIRSDLSSVQRLLPASGNPVWVSPTADTDFRLMQNDLKVMLGTVDNIENTPSWSSNFHTMMLNVHSQATTLIFNILDATPYMYVTPSFIFANSLWLLGIIGLARFVSVMKK